MNEEFAAIPIANKARIKREEISIVLNTTLNTLRQSPTSGEKEAGLSHRSISVFSAMSKRNGDRGEKRQPGLRSLGGAVRLRGCPQRSTQ